MLQIVGGKILDPASGQEFEGDLAIENGRIARIDKRGLKPSVTGPNTEVLHIHGAVCAPALWDIHVHLREPGEEHKETITTGAQAAIRGGIGRIFAMPNTVPALDNEKIVRQVRKSAEGQKELVDIEVIGAVTKERAGKEPVDLYALARAGAAAFSDDGAPVRDGQTLKLALEETSALGSLVIDHCEEETLVRGGVMHEGEVSRSLGLPGMPSESEAIWVFRDIEIMRKSRGRLHLAHISTGAAIKLIAKAKTNGLGGRLTCEVTPHHFALSEEAVRELGPSAKMDPPLRSREDLKAIREAISDGTIDAIASDHAPHSDWEKNQGLTKAPFGVIGMETMLPVTITYLVREGFISLMKAIELLTIGPARVMGRLLPKIEPGEPADLVIFDPNETVTFHSFASKSRNSPFLGQTLYGKVLATIHNGQAVYKSSR